MTYGQAAAAARNPRLSAAARRHYAALVAAHDRAHAKRHATALQRPPVRVPAPTRPAVPPTLAALPGVAQMAAPITGIEQVGADVVQGIAHLLGAQDSLAASRCAPGEAGWPECATPGGSVQALIDSGLPPAQAAAVVRDVQAMGGVGGGGRSPADRGLLREA